MDGGSTEAGQPPRAAARRKDGGWRIPAGVAAVVVAGLALGMSGATDRPDALVRQVLRAVRDIAWSDLWWPAYVPPPIDTHTYRPLMVVLVKLQLLLAGDSPLSMSVLHALSLPW